MALDPMSPSFLPRYGLNLGQEVAPCQKNPQESLWQYPIETYLGIEVASEEHTPKEEKKA